MTDQLKPDAAAIAAAHNCARRNGAEHISKITAAVEAAYAADSGLAALVKKAERTVQDYLAEERLALEQANVALVAENERLHDEKDELVKVATRHWNNRDAIAAQVATLRAAVLHMADEINGQLQTGTLKDAAFGSRVYWAQVAGVGRSAYSATAPK